jgi:hypothetical protein
MRPSVWGLAMIRWHRVNIVVKMAPKNYSMKIDSDMKNTKMMRIAMKNGVYSTAPNLFVLIS